MASSLLKNKYWVLRHGRSIPNEKGLIVSHLSNGIKPENGLAVEGFAQARAAGEHFVKEVSAEGISLENVRIYCSPFSRTRDTTEAVADVLQLKLGLPFLQILEELRERYFGPTLELQSHNHYAEIWALDESNPFVGPSGGESVEDVAKRVIMLLAKIESDCQGCAVLIVSHGDTLQILQTVVNAVISPLMNQENFLQGHTDGIFNFSVLSHHRKYALQTGELRRVI